MIILYSIDYRNGAGRPFRQLLSVNKTLTEAKAHATALFNERPYLATWMIDLDEGKRRDGKGRRITHRDDFAESMIYAYKTGKYVPGAEMVGIDNPDRPYQKPVWTMTLARYEEYLSTITDDIFDAWDREHHQNMVAMAIAWNKPVPDDVAAEFERIRSGSK
jgi:hypothetical protein